VEAIHTLLRGASGGLPDQARDRLLRQAAAGFKTDGADGSRVLAVLIENLVHSRSRYAPCALEVAYGVEPAPELLSALRRIAWAGMRRSGRRGRFEPELASEPDSVGWSLETHRTVKALAARALRALAREADAPPAAEPGGEAPPSSVPCALCSKPRPVEQAHYRYSARVLPCRPGELPDYRELRLHAYSVCASCSNRVRRRSAVALAATALCALLAFLLRSSTPLLLVSAAAVLACVVWLAAARRSGVSAWLKRKALQQRRVHSAPGANSGFQIVPEHVMVWPFIRPAPADVPRQAVCDVCGAQVAYAEGYCLATSQVMGEPRYWESAFARRWAHCRDLGPKSPEVAALAQQQAERSTMWLVCETCMSLFRANRENARFECRTWWERSQNYRPESAGPGNYAAALQAARTGWERAFGAAPPPTAPPAAPNLPGTTE